MKCKDIPCTCCPWSCSCACGDGGGYPSVGAGCCCYPNRCCNGSCIGDTCAGCGGGACPPYACAETVDREGNCTGQEVCTSNYVCYTS